jgi:hypothetical protein
MAQAPLPVQLGFQAINVIPGAFGSTDGGWLSDVVAGDVSVRIDGDPNGFFSVSGLETFALEVDHDPDLPPGPHPRSWQSVAVVDGPGPIFLAKKTLLDVSVLAGCPVGTAPGVFGASAVVVGDDGSLVSLPLELQVVAPIVPIIEQIEVSPSFFTIAIPGTLPAAEGVPTSQQYTAAAHASDGSILQLDPASVIWSSTNTNAASIKEGLATAGSNAGTTFIIAIFDGVEGKAQLNVEDSD